MSCRRIQPSLGRNGRRLARPRGRTPVSGPGPEPWRARRWLRRILCCSLWGPLILLALWASPTLAGKRYEQALLAASAGLPPGTQVAAVISDPSGERVLDHNGDLLLRPASTLKLLTATVALHQLGGDFRFITRLRQLPSGDLVLQFVGDPLFAREDLHALLRKAVSAGLAGPVERIFLDGRVFEGHDWSDAQGWDDRHTCFAAPVSAISLDGNCFKAAVKAGSVGQRARVGIAGQLPVSITSDAFIVSSQERKRRLCRLELRHRYRGFYGLYGCAAPWELPMQLSVAVLDPVAYVSAVVLEEAGALGIEVVEGVQVGQPQNTGTLLAEHRSGHLELYLQRALKRSDNRVADALFKTLGGDHFTVPGNYRLGAAAVREVLQEHAGIDLGNSRIADGSGLSPHTRLSVSQLLDTLQHIAQLPDRRLWQALPVSGESGTLKRRYGLSVSPLKGRIRAKTGYLNGTYNLAGYFTDSRGQTLNFVIFVSGYSLAPGEGAELGARGEARPVDRFYREFFQGIL